jgi:hypothetical protein
MPPSNAQELAVLRSVIYASLFDYPLTLGQLRNSLVEVAADEATIASWWKSSALLQSTIECRGGLYFPAGRGDLLETRTRRERLSRDLLERDRAMLAFIARLPFVRMVALSGSLAHLNAEGSADVDLFVITRANRVWLVTVAMLLVSKIMGWRKRLCMNYVISERQMTIAPADLFSANQIIHLRPIAGWPMYQRFLEANPFVFRCYPNFRPASSLETEGRRPKAEWLLSLGLAQLGENVSRVVYRWHLRRQSARWQSRDQVRLEDECLKLHTSSHRAETMARFESAMRAATAPRCERAGALPVLAARG